MGRLVGGQRQHRRCPRRAPATQAGRRPLSATICHHRPRRRISDGYGVMMLSRRPTRGPGIRMRLLVANSVVVIAGIATTSVVAAIVGPPMFRRLMDEAVGPGLNGDPPYERAFRHATRLSVGIALGVSALTALTLSWYLSRRVHRSATALSQAASAVSKGHHHTPGPPPGLEK